MFVCCARAGDTPQAARQNNPEAASTPSRWVCVARQKRCVILKSTSNLLRKGPKATARNAILKLLPRVGSELLAANPGEHCAKARELLSRVQKERKYRQAEGGFGRRRQRDDLSRLLRERPWVFGIASRSHPKPDGRTHSVGWPVHPCVIIEKASGLSVVLPIRAFQGSRAVRIAGTYRIEK